MLDAGLSVLGHRAKPDSTISAILTERLRHFMARERMSLDKLSDFLGVCRNSLSRVYDGETVPPIQLIRRLANVFAVPAASLVSVRQRHGTLILRNEDAVTLSSEDGRFKSRALFPYWCKRRVEFFELRIAGGHVENAVAHAPGTIECLVVARGRVEISSGKELPQVLAKGDAIVFDADVPHRYENLSKTEAILYLMMSYVRLNDEMGSPI